MNGETVAAERIVPGCFWLFYGGLGAFLWFHARFLVVAEGRPSPGLTPFEVVLGTMIGWAFWRLGGAARWRRSSVEILAGIAGLALVAAVLS